MSTLVSEVTDRHTRLRKLMERHELDAILVTEKFNYWYLTGHQSREFDKIMRPMIFLLPREGDPCAIIYRQQLPKLLQSCPNAQGYGYEDVPFDVSLLAKAITDCGLEAARLGMELGENQRLGMPYSDVRSILETFPGLTPVDAGPALESLRMHKTPYELDALRAACDLSLRAWERTLMQLRDGCRESDVRRILSTELSSQGSDFDVAGHVSTATTSKGILGAGDTIWADFGGTFAGYQADVARRAVFGPASADQQKVAGDIAQLVDSCMEAVRPGNEARDIAQACSDALVRLGMPALTAKKRIGHGLGLNAGEPPSLSLNDTTILAPGMVICIEPRFFLPSGEKVHVEDVVVVTEKGFEYISSGATELAIIALADPSEI